MPRLVQFTGQIAAPEAASLAQPVSITFALYSSQFGESPEWLETQNVILDAEGRFTVGLGAGSPGGLPQELFNDGSARWLGVRVNPGRDSDGAALPEQPRVLLMSVPYALKAADAETVGGLPASAFLLNPDALAGRLAAAGGLASLSDAPPTAAISGSGTTNYIPKWTDGPSGVLGDSALREVSGKFGVNVTPDYVLDMSAGTGAQNLLRLSRPGENIFTMWADSSENAELHLADGTGTSKVKLGTKSGDYRLDMNADTGAQSIIRVYRPGENILNLSTDASENSILYLNNGSGTNTITLNTAGDSVFSGGNVGIGTTTPGKRLDVAGDVTVAANGTFIGPPGMLLTHANFGTALGYDTGTATMLAGDGGMEAQTGTTNSVDDTVGGVFDVTDLSKASTIADGLSRTGAFVSARARWKSTINSNHVFYVLAGGAGTSGALSSGGVKYGFGFKAEGSTLKGFTISGGSANVVTLSSCTPCSLSNGTWVDLLAVRRATTVEFYVNGVSRGSTSTSLPSSAGSTYEVRTENGASGSNVVLQVAYLTTGMPY